MNRTVTLYLLVLLLSSVLCACGRSAPVAPADFRGVPKEQLQERREEILARHADGSSLSQRETAEVEALRDQERRLIFRDDGSVSVGARGGYYDELGIYKFTSPEEPPYESTWTLTYDEEGKPVVLVARPDGDNFLYPFHDARRSVHELQGDLQTAVETGFIFKKNQ